MKQSLGAKALLFPAPVLMVATYDRGGIDPLLDQAFSVGKNL
jgi:hypothetical protein